MSIRSSFEEAAHQWQVDNVVKVLADTYELNPLQTASVHQYLTEKYVMEPTAQEGVTRPPVYESVSTINETDGSVSTKNYVSVSDDQGGYHKIDTTKASQMLSPEEYGNFTVNLARVASGATANQGEVELFQKIKGGLQPFIDQVKQAGTGKLIVIGVGTLAAGGLLYLMARGRRKKAA